MPTSATVTVDTLLASLPDDRRQEVAPVLDVIRRRLPRGYVESATSKMICWTVPLSVYPDTYNKQPLWYAALAMQKSYLSLHLMPVYADATQEKKLRDAFAAAGKRLDMGKACVRFKRADQLELDAIGDIIASVPMERWIEIAKAVWKKK
jgi:hypothetical protein